MKAYLIGYMGVGKTTLGKKLASRLGVPFVDLDTEVERSAGRSIAAIFADKGEHTFRELEHRALMQFAKSQGPGRLSTGGGAPMHYDNLEQMLGSGVVVWLQLPAAMLAARILKNADKRPIVKGIAPESLPGFIEKHLEERSTMYGRAHLRANTARMDAEAIDKLADQIREKAASFGWE